jgi:hypothetical protein
MPTPMLRDERQLGQTGDRPAGTQHRVGQLEQRIRPTGQTLIEPLAEPGQLPACTSPAGVVHTDQLKPLVVIFLLSQEE